MTVLFSVGLFFPVQPEMRAVPARKMTNTFNKIFPVFMAGLIFIFLLNVLMQYYSFFSDLPVHMSKLYNRHKTPASFFFFFQTATILYMQQPLL